MLIFALQHAYRQYRYWRWALWGGLLAYALSACTTNENAPMRSESGVGKPPTNVEAGLCLSAYNSYPLDP